MSAYYVSKTVGTQQQLSQAAQGTIDWILGWLQHFSLTNGLVALYGGVASIILGALGYPAFTAIGVIMGGLGLLILMAALVAFLVEKLLAAIRNQ